MLSKVQPCFQLLRIGSSSSSATDVAQDLYTFRPALTHSVFRLGRTVELCDVVLQSASISRIHAELHAEREEAGEEKEEGWRVLIKDRGSHGTWVNEIRLQPGVQWELSDGDTLTFGGQSDGRSPEFYFLFQKVLVRPSDFDAITVPKASSFSSDLQNRIRTSQEPKMEPNLDLSPLSINKATVILNSIGSLSKMNGSCWTFKRTDKDNAHQNSASSPPFRSIIPPSTPPPFLSTTSVSSSMSVPPSSKSRRKSAHTVLLEDDSSDEMHKNGQMEDRRRKKGRKRRRLCKSESEVFHPCAPKAKQAVCKQLELKPELNRSAQCATLRVNAKPGHLFSVSGQRQGFRWNLKMGSDIRAPPHPPRKALPLSSRGRRRAHSSPVYSSMVVGGENYTLVSPSLRLYEGDGDGDGDRERGGFTRIRINNSKRRGRPRKHPLPQPRPRSPSSSSSSSTSSSSSSSSSSSEDERVRGEEPCASACCRLPQQETVQWIQCDDCDAWYHVDCIQRDQGSRTLDTSADFHCGCCR
ncbi:hypothetical protein SKAU_G00400510 [Synaphobranchus kaupii]|uniref:FHA domain-containing protein n=1 Tax=Synaphobranchus kaupii TaxID=118154 RepID=A0A9Q1ICB7_SYNKA|nr:hypothetical protein SKAU_G00400510 [Synaphobranchus kaupii]